MICVDTKEILYFFRHDYFIENSSCDKENGNPNNFYTKILLFDIDTGVMLSSINVGLDTFVHESGDLLHSEAIFVFRINDYVFQEGINENYYNRF